ncbi:MULTISPECIES: hypothetical protein [Shewanella]|uniref:hypothetical protein n=1 Tax=Shewanella TaxID=22 RepID=UPI000E7371BE|nr:MULTISPECIES: hypothetical protein [Shewanella]
MSLNLKIIITSLLSICLFACAGKPKVGENLVVMKLTIPSYATVKVRNIDTNEIKSVKLKYLNGSFFVAYLPSGTYELVNYNPFKDVSLSAPKGNVRFVVVDNCSNYLGQLNLLGNYFHSNGKPTKIFWELNKDQKFHSWIVDKMKDNPVCTPYNDGVGKYSWEEFEKFYILKTMD